MSKLILNIYDLFRRRRWLCLSIFAALTAVLVALVMTLHYKEDISDFLPLDHDNQQAMSVYQDISGANRIYAFVMMRDSAQNSPERLAEGVDLLTQTLAETDTAGLLPDVISSIDLEQIMGVASAVYDDIPYFMTERDYARADSLLAIPGYTAAQLMNDKEQLQSPAAGFSVETMSRDPLGLFSPVAARIHSGGSDIEFDNFDGYILSPDGKRAIVMMDSRMLLPLRAWLPSTSSSFMSSLSTSTFKSFNMLSDEYPLPKSSMCTANPAARNSSTSREIIW